jgi:hypothetical protein
MERVMNWYGNEVTPSWGPKITKAMTMAYEDALARAQELGLKNRYETSDIIARYIVQGAKRGKYDPKVLADGAVRFLRRD